MMALLSVSPVPRNRSLLNYSLSSDQHTSIDENIFESSNGEKYRSMILFYGLFKLAVFYDQDDHTCKLRIIACQFLDEYYCLIITSFTRLLPGIALSCN